MIGFEWESRLGSSWRSLDSRVVGFVIPADRRGSRSETEDGDPWGVCENRVCISRWWLGRWVCLPASRASRCSWVRVGGSDARRLGLSSCVGSWATIGFEFSGRTVYSLWLRVLSRRPRGRWVRFGQDQPRVGSRPSGERRLGRPRTERAPISRRNFPPQFLMTNDVISLLRRRFPGAVSRGNR